MIMVRYANSKMTTLAGIYQYFLLKTFHNIAIAISLCSFVVDVCSTCFWLLNSIEYLSCAHTDRVLLGLICNITFTTFIVLKGHQKVRIYFLHSRVLFFRRRRHMPRKMVYCLWKRQRKLRWMSTIFSWQLVCILCIFHRKVTVWR